MNTNINKEVEVIHLGMIDYQRAWDFQTDLFNKIIEAKTGNRTLPPQEQKKTPNHLLFCQHPHVFTLGKSGKKEHLLLDEVQLKEEEATFYHINRGGDITYHGPGQIVGYPILDLDNFFTDIHKYLRLIEEAVILTLSEYNILAGRVKGLTGVWIEGEDPDRARKICAIGVKSSRWVTMHGFAFNVNTDLKYFDHIIPCGIPDKAVTSMQKEIGVEVHIEEVKAILLNKLKELFEFNIIDEKRYSYT